MILQDQIETEMQRVMPWTKKEYPPSLKYFMAPVRNKAIEIANALLYQGSDEGRALAIASKKATEWGEKRGKKIKKNGHQ